MKKNLLLSVALLLCIGLAAQKVSSVRENRQFLVLSGGPSFPVSDFASTDLSNQNAGLAKTGFNINLNYGYDISRNWGVAAGFVYSKYGLDISQFTSIDPAIKADHWQYYGILVGPMLTLPVNSKAKFDVNLMTGAVNMNSPKMDYQGETLMSEEWQFTMPVQTGFDFRYQFGKNGSLFGGLSYLYAEPRFLFQGSTERVTQKISTLNLSVGAGLRF